MQQRVVIAIPIYNEEKYVCDVLQQIRQYHQDLLVIDDGSTDDTPRLLRAFGHAQILTHPRNSGYGSSIIDAINWADRNVYDWVITMDCDRQHEPQRIPDFMEAIQGDQWDLISGSRYLTQDADDDMPPMERQSINATITCIINDLFHTRLSDSFCGFKAHRVKPTVALGLSETGYAFPMQLWPRAIKAGLRITELPVRLIYNDPNRHFGGGLDDPGDRMTHYLQILNAEMHR